MNEEINEMLKVQRQDGEKISLSRLRHKPVVNKEEKLDRQTLVKLQKLKKYAHHDASIPTEKLNCYYCSLCGRIALVTNVYLEVLGRRKTDNSIAIDLRSDFLQLNFEKDKTKYLKRSGGVETQFRWKCECGIPIGYSAVPPDEIQKFKDTDNDSRHKFEWSNMPYFYILDGSLSEKMADSKLISELITYKETILLHLKKKIVKK